MIAPLRVAQSTWPDEAQKWDHLRSMSVVPILGSVAERRDALKKPAQVNTINYDNLVWLVDHWVNADGPWPWTTIIADESTRLKGFRLRQGTKRARALASVAHRYVKRWVNLTGTPAPNGLLDLWGQQWFVDRGERLGMTFRAFSDRWFYKHPSGFGLIPHKTAQAEIESRLSDVCLTVKSGLPVDKPIVSTLTVDLPYSAREIYRRMEREYFAYLQNGDQIDAANAAVKSGKLLQLANGAIYTDEEGNWKEVHDAKIQMLESVIEEASGAPVLVAYHFRSDLVRLRKAFPKARVLDKDPQTIRDWNAGRIPVLLAHPASAGHGLNLQDGGNILVFFSINWSLEEHEQIIERIGPVRQKQAGHNRPVYVYYITCDDTIEDAVMQRLLHKRSVQDALMSAMTKNRSRQP